MSQHTPDCPSAVGSVEQYDPDIEGWVEYKREGGDEALCNCVHGELRQLQAVIAEKEHELERVKWERDLFLGRLLEIDPHHPDYLGGPNTCEKG